MLVVLMVALVPGVMAQDSAICGNLSADDCATLTTALTNTSTAASGAFTLESALDLQSDDPAQAVKVDINAEGKFSGAAPTSLADMAAMSADPAGAITKITTGLKGFSGELNLTVGLPASASAMTGGQPLVINLVMVNGVAYLDFSKLPAAMTAGLAAYNIPNGWAGFDLVDILTNLGPSLASGMTSSTSTASATLPKVEALAAKYLEYTRDGDTFTGELDLVGLFNDADFQALTNMKFTPPQADAVASFKDVTFEVVFTLDGDKVSEIQFGIDVPESTAAAINATNSASGSSTIQKAGSFGVDLKYSGLGEAQTIAAPDGAPVTTFMELMTMISNAQQQVLQGLNSTPTPAQ
jgi:hypothetical protein